MQSMVKNMVRLYNGVDILEICRVKRLMQNPRFLIRFFTVKEISYFKSRHYRVDVIAGRFAAKEALAKAIGTGIDGFSFKDIEVLAQSSGAPCAVLHGGALASLNRISSGYLNCSISLSITHSRKQALAFCTIICYGS